jgi:hypothetical protein
MFASLFRDAVFLRDKFFTLKSLGLETAVSAKHETGSGS